MKKTNKYKNYLNAILLGEKTKKILKQDIYNYENTPNTNLQGPK